MPPLIECVPNFSEGRDPRVIGALESAVRSVPHVALLDVHADSAHHRSVFTFAGAPEGVVEAAFAAAKVATSLIDLRKHRGEHPRIGATDVVPLVPLEEIDMKRCVLLAGHLGRRLGEELEVPVFLYARAARRRAHTHLAEIRRGEFEGLGERFKQDPALMPDFGPARIHPSAGATAVGARPVLVAFNVLLTTDDVALARQIARSIRTSSAGVPAVQAKGFLVGGRAQVSMNLLDIDVTSPLAVFDAVKEHAAAGGVEILKSEIVGLVPERALPRDAVRMLKLEGPVEERILERRIGEVVGEL